MSHYENMPSIRLIPSQAVRFHENPEGRRTNRLTERLRQEGILRNPPIVADMHDGHYLLLDGANRVSSLRALNYSHIPVQVVDYGDEDIQLKSWHHLLIQGRSLNLLDAFGMLQNVEVRSVSPRAVERHLELREVSVILMDGGPTCWGLFPTQSPDIVTEVNLMGEVVSLYEGRSDLERIKLADFTNLPDVIRSLEHQLCLFPCLHKTEVLELARAGVMIPTGITRHLIPGRALGLNLELGFLDELDTEESKQSHFRRYLDELDVGGRIRFYEESVFIMNE